MISRRDKLLNYPWEQQRYEQHRRKVHSAKPAVDVRTPPFYPHVFTKPKKVQSEKERLRQIEKENIRLLQKLGDIMSTKRIQNFWSEPRPNFLNRQKLFETRPYSSLPKLISVYAPFADYEPKSPLALNSNKVKTARRCPTCIGRPEQTIVQIPELRIPWQPKSKSWNVKTPIEKLPRKCLHCGHYKKS